MSAVIYTYDDRIVSDLHKDAHGFRPTEYFWAQWNNANPDQKQDIWEELVRAVERENDDYVRRTERAKQELQATIARIRDASPGLDVRGALRWLAQANDAIFPGEPLYEGAQYDWGYLEYKLGVPYGHIVNLLKEAGA